MKTPKYSIYYEKGIEHKTESDHGRYYDREDIHRAVNKHLRGLELSFEMSSEATLREQRLIIEAFDYFNRIGLSDLKTVLKNE